MIDNPRTKICGIKNDHVKAKTHRFYWFLKKCQKSNCGFII